MTQHDGYISRSLWLRYAKRPFDVIASLTLIVLFSPILLLTSMAVKLTSPGPLLFRQERSGKDGKLGHGRLFCLRKAK